MVNGVSKSRAIVIGGDGFIGQAIVKKLISFGVDVDIFSNRKDRKVLNTSEVYIDICDREQVLDLVKDADYLFHFGGVLGTSELNDDTYNAVNTNIGGTINLLDASRNNNIGSIIYPAKPNVWFNTYTLTKKVSYDFLKLYRELYDLDIKILMLRNVYGPNQSSHFVRKLFPHIMECASLGKPIDIYGSGNQAIDLIHVSDVADIAVNLAFCKNKCNEIPIDTGRTVRMSVLDFIKKVEETLNKRLELSFLPMRAGENEYEIIPTPEVSTITDFLGLNEQSYNLEKGIRETYEYYRGINV